MTARRLLEAAGIAIVFSAPFVFVQLAPGNHDLYHRLLPVTSVDRGLLLDLGVAFLLSAAMLWALDRARPRLKALGWLAASVGLSWMLTRDVVLLVPDLKLPVPVPHLNYTLWVPLIALLLAPLVLLGWSRGHGSGFRRTVDMIRFGLACTGCAIFIIVPQLAYRAARAQPAERAGFHQEERALVAGDAATGKRRILWILLDEFSYDQGFDHRQRSVVLPQLDALARNSTLFTEAQPAGYLTELVVPSLLLGRLVVGLSSSGDGMPSVRYARQKQWIPFQAKATIFGDARRLGWNTGVVGWYNPYCRILRDVLDSCYWNYNSPMPNGLSGSKPAVANALSILPLAALGKAVLQSNGQAAPRRLHVDEYRALMAHARSLVADTSIRFALIHLPVPHPLGIYNRRTRRVTEGGTYLDNMVLADEVVGELLRELNGIPCAGDTTVIVSSDHSWRVPMWRFQPGWTAEEETASQGRFDPRPLLMIHFPGQTAGEEITAPTSALLLHEMLEAMLRGQMDSPQELRRWLAGRQHAG
jgi:hypothetical protein